MQDITGTSSMRLHRDTNKPDRQLLLDDIEGSKPRRKSMFRTGRCIDPLVPEYTLPSFHVPPLVTPKFTRDSHDISDIEGTKSKPLYPFAQRQNHLVDDIEGAWPGWKPRHRRARYDSAPLDHSLNVSDITGGAFRTRRSTNPLTPSYRVNGMDIADDPIKCKPRGLSKARDGPFNPLTTKDIEGAQSGWKPTPKMNPPMDARRHFRNTNFMGDIPGAQADTLKHSICTNRYVNPLDPVYTSLDGEPLANPQTPLYKKPACIEAEAQLDAIIASEAATQDVRNSGAKVTVKRENQEESRQSEKLLEALVGPRPSSEPLISSHGGGISHVPEASCKDRQEGPMNTRRNGSPPDQSAPPTLKRGKTQAGNATNSSLFRQVKDEMRPLLSRSGGALQHWPPISPVALSAVDPGNSSSSSAINRGISARSWPISSTDLNRKSPNDTYKLSRPSMSTSAGGLPRPHATSGVPPRVPLGRTQSAASGERTGGNGGGAVVIRSQGENGNQYTERLVLRSANGKPRVPLTPSERRSAQEYRDEVSSVRDLL